MIQKDICPFCQRPYLDDDIIAELRSYFNEDYEKAVADIESKGKTYKDSIDLIPDIDAFTNIPIIHELEQTFALAFRAYKEAVNSNLIEIRKKYQTPSQIVELENTSTKLGVVNSIIQQANAIIVEFNKKVVGIDGELAIIKRKNSGIDCVMIMINLLLTIIIKRLLLKIKYEHAKLQNNMFKV